MASRDSTSLELTPHLIGRHICQLTLDHNSVTETKITIGTWNIRTLYQGRKFEKQKK